MRAPAADRFTVGRLREWIDQPRFMGLQPKLQNLVILAFAAQADRVLMRNGVPIQASLDRIEDTAEVKEVLLPSEISWAKARDISIAVWHRSTGGQEGGKRQTTGRGPQNFCD